MTTPSGRNTDKEKLNQLERIIDIMRQLRDPETGCPWDVEQDFSTIAPYTIEEAYEVADAVQRGNIDDIRTSSAICCCRSSSSRGSPRKPGCSPSPM